MNLRTDHWLITHNQIQVSRPLGVSYDANLPMRDTLALVDRNTRQVKPFLFRSERQSLSSSLSHTMAPGSPLFQFEISIRKYTSCHSARRRFQSRIGFPVTDGSTWDDKPNFSFDDKLIFFTSDRDGFRCIWAQPPHRATCIPRVIRSRSIIFIRRRRSLANLPIGRMNLCRRSRNPGFQPGRDIPEISGYTIAGRRRRYYIPTYLA